MKKIIYTLIPLLFSTFVQAKETPNSPDWDSMDYAQSQNPLDSMSRHGGYLRLKDNLKIMLTDLGLESKSTGGKTYQKQNIAVDLKDNNKVLRVAKIGMINKTESTVWSKYWDNNIVIFTLDSFGNEGLNNDLAKNQSIYIYNRKNHIVFSRMLTDSSVPQNSNPQHNDYDTNLLDRINQFDGDVTYNSKANTYTYKATVIHSKRNAAGKVQESKMPISFTLKLDSQVPEGIKCITASDDCGNFGWDKATPLN